LGWVGFDRVARVWEGVLAWKGGGLEVTWGRRTQGDEEEEEVEVAGGRRREEGDDQPATRPHHQGRQKRWACCSRVEAWPAWTGGVF
jgi:hypothetical protein